jgi:hypothetical protein
LETDLRQQLYLLEVSDETNQHRGFDFMCVLRVGGVGAAANVQGLHPVG